MNLSEMTIAELEEYFEKLEREIELTAFALDILESAEMF